MKLDLTDLFYALSFALDMVEAELLGVDTGHGKRVAYLAILMGKEAGFGEEELRDFVGCCLLHDNALTEYIHQELSGSTLSEQRNVTLSDLAMQNRAKLDRDHSITGEENIRLLPFRTDVRGIILYHHENADGTGALGMTADQTPLKAQILHLADLVDASCPVDLGSITPAGFETLCQWVQSQSGSVFSREVTDLFLKAVRYEKIVYLQSQELHACLHEELGREVLTYTDEQIHNIARLFANIVDYKSEFTQKHSTGVSEKAEIMARYYGFDDEKTTRFYFAGAMHDIGKLAIVNDVLEKPGKLTDKEFSWMKDHSDATRYILSQIHGIGDIVDWAANHHEKLGGTGYPQGLTVAQLSFEEQLMACIDIYQALTETRPYRERMSHEKAMELMKTMVDRGELNGAIVTDIDRVFESNSTI